MPTTGKGEASSKIEFKKKNYRSKKRLRYGLIAVDLSRRGGFRGTHNRTARRITLPGQPSETLLPPPPTRTPHFAMQLDFSSADLPAPSFLYAVSHDDGGFSTVTICGVPLRLRQSDILGGRLWSGGVRLAVEIEKGIALRTLGESQGSGKGGDGLHGKRVIELGAGCAGLPGVALAIKHGMTVTLTEHPDVVPILRENIESVKAQIDELLKKGEVSNAVADAVQQISVASFDWNDEKALSQYADETNNSSFPLVVWADAGYFSDHLKLVKAAVAVTSPTGVILAVESLRSESSTRTFRKAFGCAGLFAVRVLGKGNRNVDETWTLAMEWQNQSEAREARKAVCEGAFETIFKQRIDLEQNERNSSHDKQNALHKHVSNPTKPPPTPELIRHDEDEQSGEFGAQQFWGKGFDASLVPDDA